MLRRLRNRHFFLIDISLIPLAVYFSYVLRLERFNIEPFWASSALFVISALVITPIVFRRVGIYSRYWLYASIEELFLLVGALAIVAIAAGLINFGILQAYEGDFLFPRSVPFIFLLLGLGVTAGPRLAVRTAAVYKRSFPANQPIIPVLVMGAGDAGAKLVREIQINPQLSLDIVGFVDDDPNKLNMQIHGIRVLGDRHKIPKIVDQYNIQQIIIAMPSASGQAMRDILRICEQTEAETKTMPAMHGLIDGTVTVQQLRNVQIEDLLRREPVKTDYTAVGEMIRGRRVLITGAGGSIGSELCRQLIQFKPAEVILFGHGENSIFGVFHELRQLDTSHIKLSPVIADLRFPNRLQAVFQEYKPEIVFHAAAHKHVPLMELNQPEAVTNNIMGTRNLLNAALAVNVQHFVMISTDKAVNPTSMMGASKRTAEFLVHQAAQKSGRPYVAVRFGNVLGSRGSVVLTFKNQIAAGGPITITHPDMRRFFMTIPEAVQLVLQAGALGRGGEVFVLDMGEPVRIIDLARDLIELSGLKVGDDIEINISGIRPGEKLFEELFVEGESYKRTRHEKIFIAENASALVPEDLEQHIEALITAAYAGDKLQIYALLNNLIHEYELPEEISKQLHNLPTATPQKENAP